MDVLNEEIIDHVREWAKRSGLIGEAKIIVGELTNSGDNYLGVVYSVKAEGIDSEGKEKIVSFVLKCMHQDETTKESFQSDSVFSIEDHFYSKLVPAFKDLQKKHGRDSWDALDFVPKCYLSKVNFILLEDLRTSNFQMRDRTKGLSREECLLVMKSLGKLHAFSYAMKDKYPQQFVALLDKVKGHPFFSAENRARYYDQFQEMAVGALKGVRLHSEELGMRLQTFVSKGVFDVLLNICSKKDEHSVIVHNDVWTNNVLFLGDPPTDVRVLDYQLMLYTSPAADLMYTIYSSVRKEIRDEHFEEFLHEYHTTLTKVLCHLGVNPDTLPMNILKEQMKIYSDYSFALALFLIPIFFGKVTEDVCFSCVGDGMSRHVSNHSVYMKETRVQMMVVGLVQEFIDRGYFNH